MSEKQEMKIEEIPSGTLELLKWIALLLMTGDHVNKYLLDHQYPVLFNAGRVAMPIFMLVFAYNLARADSLTSNRYRRSLFKLFFAGGVSCIPFIALGVQAKAILMGWWPLNILFAFFFVTLIVFFIEMKTPVSNMLAALGFIVGGALVEYWWPALMLGVAVWHYCRTASLGSLCVIAISMSLLCVINGNFYGWLAIPVIFSLKNVSIPIKKSKLAFYAYYPLHLAALYAIRNW